MFSTSFNFSKNEEIDEIMLNLNLSISVHTSCTTKHLLALIHQSCIETSSDLSSYDDAKNKSGDLNVPIQ